MTSAKKRRHVVDRWLIAGLAGLALAGCSGDAAPTDAEVEKPAEHVIDAPAGTALLVDKIAVARTEVERWAGWIKTCEPQYVENACRRFALTNGLLERAATAAHFPVEYAAAEARARTGAEQLRAGHELSDATVEQLEGTWAQIGLQIWGELQPVELGRWVGPFARPGTWTLARALETEVVRGLEVLRVEVVNYPYIAPHSALADITGAVDGSLLRVVDPEFDSAIPESWKYRMRGRDQ